MRTESHCTSMCASGQSHASFLCANSVLSERACADGGESEQPARRARVERGLGTPEHPPAWLVMAREAGRILTISTT